MRIAKIFLLLTGFLLSYVAQAGDFKKWCEDENAPELIKKSIACFKKEALRHYPNTWSCEDLDAALKDDYGWVFFDGIGRDSECRYEEMTPFLELSARNLRTSGIFVDDWSFLLGYKNLKRLTHLNFREGQFEKMKPTLLKMEGLEIFEGDATNDPCDLSVFKDLNLFTLDFACATMSDFSELSHMPNLNSLRLQNGLIQNIDALESFSRLTNLELPNNKIENIEVIQKLENVWRLNISNNPLRDVCVLKDKPKSLTILDISYSGVKDLSCFSQSKHIKWIYAKGNGLEGTACPIAEWGACEF